MAEELEAVVVGLAGLVPTFEQNGEAVAGYLPRCGQFVRFYYEDGNLGDDAIEVMGSGYQQFAGRVLIEYEEAGLAKYYDELVSILEFSRGPELRSLLDADPFDDAVEKFYSGLAVGQKS